MKITIDFNIKNIESYFRKKITYVKNKIINFRINRYERKNEEVIKKNKIIYDIFLNNLKSNDIIPLIPSYTEVVFKKITKKHYILYDTSEKIIFANVYVNWYIIDKSKVIINNYSFVINAMNKLGLYFFKNNLIMIKKSNKINLGYITDIEYDLNDFLLTIYYKNGKHAISLKRYEKSIYIIVDYFINLMNEKI